MQELEALQLLMLGNLCGGGLESFEMKCNCAVEMIVN